MVPNGIRTLPAGGLFDDSCRLRPQHLTRYASRMLKSHRVCLRPTPNQESMFQQHAGYARFAYNWALGEFKAGLDMGEWLSDKTLRPRWNRVKNIIAPWNRELSQNAAKYAVIDMGQAASRWGQYRAQRKAGRKLPAGRIPAVQAAQARAGLSCRQRAGYGQSRRQGRHAAQSGACSDGGGG